MVPKVSGGGAVAQKSGLLKNKLLLKKKNKFCV